MIILKWRGHRRLNNESKTDGNGIILILELPGIMKKFYLKHSSMS